MDTGADHEWVDWLRGLLKTGADALGAQPAGDPVLGLRGRTVGCRVTTGAGDRWLRVVTEPTGWAYGPSWTGNVDAAGITGVRHPDVLNTAEWDEHDRRARAELMTLAPGRAIATDMALRDRVNLDDTWWINLRASLDALAAHPTDRVCLDAELLRLRILAAFGVTVEPDTLTWTTAHGDLHWANLTNPSCWILDWESWGTAPAGYDAALLHAVSLLRTRATPARVARATRSPVAGRPVGIHLDRSFGLKASRAVSALMRSSASDCDRWIQPVRQQEINCARRGKSGPPLTCGQQASQRVGLRSADPAEAEEQVR